MTDPLEIRDAFYRSYVDQIARRDARIADLEAEREMWETSYTALNDTNEVLEVRLAAVIALCDSDLYDYSDDPMAAIRAAATGV